MGWWVVVGCFFFGDLCLTQLFCCVGIEFVVEVGVGQ